MMASHARHYSSDTAVSPGPSLAADRRVAALIEDRLLELQAAGRRAVRIVDASCGSGAALIRAVVRARMLGFVAIEGRGVDRSGDDIMIACWATRNWRDPAIGLSFEVGDIAAALAGEDDRAVDLLLCARGALERLPILQRRDAAGAIRRTADLLILKGGRDAPAGAI